MPKKMFKMTVTELKLKRERMMEAFKAGCKALEELRVPYFLAYGSALGALREGQFQPLEDDITVGIYSWDLAGLQRQCTECTARERDMMLKRVFERHGFEPVAELLENPAQQAAEAAAAGQTPGAPSTMSACPRVFLAEGWSEDMAFPIIYKFTHRESFVRFDMIIFTMQFGQMWDFADGGAETSSGWRYTPFSPQPVEFEKMMTFTMPPDAIAAHYGPNWHAPRHCGYIENLSRCENRCQVLRVYPFESRMPNQRDKLPPPVPWEEFRTTMRQYRIKYAHAMAGSEDEYPPRPLDLYKIESKPVVLFQAAGICKTEGNARMKKESFESALDKYDEGVYIMLKCREVLTTWRLIFRQIHNEKAEKDRKDRGLKTTDCSELEMPREFRADEDEERSMRLTLLLNGAQAALQAQKWEAAEARAGDALELDPKSLKGLYRRGLARAAAGRESAAADFWTMLRLSDFESKEALVQLQRLLPKEEVQKQLRQLKRACEKEQRLGTMLTELEEDERVGIQEDRYQRYLADCEQRRHDGQREISFDDWVKQYEWRYDAEERAKARSAWPEYFSHIGPAPLPVEEWEIDYLTHKEIEKIMYRKQTEMMGAQRREREAQEAARKREEDDREGASFTSRLYVDKEDEQTLRDAVVRKGYNYWW